MRQARASFQAAINLARLLRHHRVRKFYGALCGRATPIVRFYGEFIVDRRRITSTEQARKQLWPCPSFAYDHFLVNGVARLAEALREAVRQQGHLFPLISAGDKACRPTTIFKSVFEA